VADLPKPRSVLAPFQRLRRRTTTAGAAAGAAADDNSNKHGGVSGHVIGHDAALPVIDERSMTSQPESGDSTRRAETLLDALHKKYYPDQYGGVSTGSDFRDAAPSVDVRSRGAKNDNDSPSRIATATFFNNRFQDDVTSSRPLLGSLRHYRFSN